MAKLWRTFYTLYYFHLKHLIFVLVWFYWWAKHISCLCPTLAVHREASEDGQCLLGSECSDHGTSTSCNNLKEWADWGRAQGWGSGVQRDVSQASSCARRNPVTATGQFWHRAGEGSECLTLSSASLACPWLSFPVGYPKTVTLCPLEMTFDPPAHNSGTGRFHSWLQS